MHYSRGRSDLAKKSGTVVFAIKGDLSTLNPITPESAITWNGYFYNLVYGMNYAIYEKDWSRHIPGLAKKWEVSSDGKAWKFYLWKGVRWHDGYEVTSDDAIFSFWYLKQNNIVPVFNKMWTRMEKIDKYGFKVYFDRPFVEQQILDRMLPPIPKHIWKQVTDPLHFAYDEAIGYGPFKFVKWVKGKHIELSANEEYFGGRPNIDTIILKIIKEDEEATNSLLNGEVDAITWPIPSHLIPKIAGRDHICIEKYLEPGFSTLVFNIRKSPMNDLTFRKAVAYCTPRRKIVKELLGEYAIELHNPVFDFYKKTGWLTSNIPRYEYSPNKAKMILNQGGYKDYDNDGWIEGPKGEKINPTLITADFNPSKETGLMIADALQKIGLLVYCETVTLNTLASKVYTASPEFDMCILSWSITGPVPDFIQDFFDSRCDVVATLGEGSNVSGFMNKDFDEFGEKQMYELDVEKRRQIFFEMERMLGEYLPFNPLFERINVHSFRTDKFQGWCTEWPNGPVSWDNIHTFSNLKKV